MGMLKSSIFLFGLIFLARPSYQERAPTRSFKLSVTSHVNQTGHYNIDLALVQANRGSRRNWQAIINHEIVEEGGIEEHRVTGLWTAPPPKPKDYELFPGIGFYKFHPEAKKFQEGISICSQEGGHLLIVNSKAEANVLITIYARHPKVWQWANIGFHDPNEDGNYKTIFGETLRAAGYDTWHPDEPDHSYGPARCGVINRQGLLGGGNCNGTRPFICEYDLTWGS
ncbi:hemolymph lipopolysaccharide-binding protein-like [Hetaerina americana]|uniref:hemolymph lipopolysaccharide-binding protein-like n=1 Tax=Hetaerina americana TaxID=62018 RepID=UPI003A7F4141